MERNQAGAKYVGVLPEPGGSHALLNDWVNNERLMNRLTPVQRNAVEEARRMGDPA